MSPPSNIPWHPAPTEFTTRLAFLLIYGETSTGKTTLALSAPGPIALFTANEKIDGIVQPFAREKEVRIFNFGLDAKDPAKSAKSLWPVFKAAIADAQTWARTIVIDTDSEAYELVRYAVFGKLLQVKPYHYEKVNTAWKAVLNPFRGLNKTCNLVAVSKIKEVYKNDKGTGEMVPSGQKDMRFMADVVVRTRRGKRTKKGAGDYTVEIKKGWWNDEVTGEYGELTGEDFFGTPRVSWAQLMGLVTETDEGEWE